MFPAYSVKAENSSLNTRNNLEFTLRWFAGFSCWLDGTWKHIGSTLGPGVITAPRSTQLSIPPG